MVSNNSPSNETKAAGPKPISEWPSKNPNRWFAVGVAAAILLMIGMGWLGIYILSLPSPWAERGQAMQVFQPFLVGMAGIVTLCTVVWRGLINEAQANEQRRQNDAKDMADVGLLLEKAGTFLVDETPVKRGVGIAMLNTVIITPKSPYAQYALELVCDELVQNYLGGTPIAIVEQIRSILLKAGSFGLFASGERIIDLSAQTSEKGYYTQFWKGFPSALIKNGEILVDDSFLEMIADSERQYRFEKTQFFEDILGISERFGISIDNRYTNCSFVGLKISSIETPPYEFWAKHVFDRCDFSDAVIRSRKNVEFSKIHRCYCRAGHPPRIEGMSAEETVHFIQTLHPDFREKEDEEVPF